MKKTIAALTLSAILVIAMPLTALAHGHGHNNGGSLPAVTGYSLCNTADCNTTGNHQHDGTTYAGHYLGDGHDYHRRRAVRKPDHMTTTEPSACLIIRTAAAAAMLPIITEPIIK